MAEISVFQFLLSPLQSRDTPADGRRKVCHNSTYEGEQALLSGGLVFVKLDFNGTATKVRCSLEAFSLLGIFL